MAVMVVRGEKTSGGRMTETKRRENYLDRGRASDSFLHGDARNKRADWFKEQDARTGWRGKGERGVTKMLRGPYSHSHGAQRAVIKRHHQTG